MSDALGTPWESELRGRFDRLVIDSPALVGNPTRLRQAAGWSPEISFDQMLDDLLAYWRRTA